MGNSTRNPLDELAASLTERRCSAQVFGGTLVVSPPLSVRERVIACDGVWFRWGSERGIALAPVDDIPAAAARAVTVLKGAAR